jgi:hypothetical protein
MQGEGINPTGIMKKVRLLVALLFSTLCTFFPCALFPEDESQNNWYQTKTWKTNRLISEIVVGPDGLLYLISTSGELLIYNHSGKGEPEPGEQSWGLGFPLPEYELGSYDPSRAGGWPRIDESYSHHINSMDFDDEGNIYILHALKFVYLEERYAPQEIDYPWVFVPGESQQYFLSIFDSNRQLLESSPSSNISFDKAENHQNNPPAPPSFQTLKLDSGSIIQSLSDNDSVSATNEEGGSEIIFWHRASSTDDTTTTPPSNFSPTGWAYWETYPWIYNNGTWYYMKAIGSQNYLYNYTTQQWQGISE